jgi:hypothetical protein
MIAHLIAVTGNFREYRYRYVDGSKLAINLLALTLNVSWSLNARPPVQLAKLLIGPHNGLLQVLMVPDHRLNPSLTKESSRIYKKMYNVTASQ